MELGGAATLVLAAGVLCLALLWEWKRQQESSKFPPGPTPLPLLGNVLQLSRRDLFTSLMALQEKYGPVFSVLLGPRRVVVLCGHEAVKEALVDHAEEFSGRGGMPTLDRIFHGYGLGTKTHFKMRLVNFLTAQSRTLLPHPCPKAPPLLTPFPPPHSPGR
uniref:Uncharacterized protein n=1 Tax=Gopherus agassizii TaxID=38772 RepID=A0A452HJW0_9SAUR